MYTNHVDVICVCRSSKETWVRAAVQSGKLARIPGCALRKRHWFAKNTFLKIHTCQPVTVPDHVLLELAPEAGPKVATPRMLTANCAINIFVLREAKCAGAVDVLHETAKSHATICQAKW